MIRYLCNVNSKPLLDMKSRYLPIMIVFLVLLGCCGRKPTTTVPDSMYPLTLIDTSQIRPDVMKVISSCIKEYPTQKAFILNCWYLYEDHGFLSNGCNIDNDIYSFQPAYEWAFTGGEFSEGNLYPSHYFRVDDNIVFVTSRNDAYLKQEPLKHVYDSVVSAVNGARAHNHKWILVYHKRDTTMILDHLSPDTILPIVIPIPRIVKSSIRFTP